MISNLPHPTSPASKPVSRIKLGFSWPSAQRDSVLRRKKANRKNSPAHFAAAVSFSKKTHLSWIKQLSGSIKLAPTTTEISVRWQWLAAQKQTQTTCECAPTGAERPTSDSLCTTSNRARIMWCSDAEEQQRFFFIKRENMDLKFGSDFWDPRLHFFFLLLFDFKFKWELNHRQHWFLRLQLDWKILRAWEISVDFFFLFLNKKVPTLKLKSD